MADPRRILVLGLMARYPMAGVGWQALQYLLGLARLGYEVYYAEDSGAHPYDPIAMTVSADCTYNVEFLRAAMERIGLADRWVYWDEPNDRYLGVGEEALHELYRTAGSIWNLCGASPPRAAHRAGAAKLVYVETDPVYEQLRVAKGDAAVRAMLDAHDVLFTYGENLGQADCPVPLSGYAWHPTRPPVVLDLWESPPPARGAWSTIATWENKGKDVEFAGETYRWSKHTNFLHYLPVAKRSGVDFEVAIRPPGEREAALLRDNGWRTVDPLAVSCDLDVYRRFIQGSRGEFTVAKDIYVRPRSGWSSDRSACYLAAGRPVVTQETAASKYVPSGEGLLTFETLDEAVVAIREVERDYERHCAAALRVAREHYAAERVLGEMLRVIGI
ncbi:MAG: hypothetical protein AB1689_05165 [Thermodesulfobacteriota bacterium]